MTDTPMTGTPMTPDQPTLVELNEQQLDALSAAGNRALNDHYHEDLCYCRSWPTSCESSGNYFMGGWDTSAFDIGLPAVLGVWETLRNDRHAAKVAELRADNETLRARVAELEGAALCPSRVATPLGTPRTSECALPVRHQGDHRNAAKNHYWGNEYAEGAAELAAMRSEHPSPCRVPDSPDCTCPVTPDQARRIEQERPETATFHDCTLPLVRRLDCGHCPHEVCQDCDRCPHTCECAP